MNLTPEQTTVTYKLYRVDKDIKYNLPHPKFPWGTYNDLDLELAIEHRDRLNRDCIDYRFYLTKIKRTEMVIGEQEEGK